jgi:hypothetical protein
MNIAYQGRRETLASLGIAMASFFSLPKPANALAVKSKNT